MVLFGEEKFVCRRKIILKYFGEEFDESECQKTCDNCLRAKKCSEINIYQFLHQLPEIFSSWGRSVTQSQLLQWLSGSRDKTVTNKTKPPEEFKSLSKNEINKLLLTLIQLDVLYELVNSQHENPYAQIFLSHENLNKHLQENKPIIIRVDFKAQSKQPANGQPRFVIKDSDFLKL